MKTHIAISFLSALLISGCSDQIVSRSVSDTNKQAHYDRIDTTQTMRCGYAVWAPLFSIDPNTKKMSGIFYDVVEESAKRLNIKIEWTEEVGWGTAATSLKNGRVDAICSGFWANSARARQVDFSTPVLYTVTNIWVRNDATYNFKSIDELNVPEFSFGYLDGSADVKATQIRFPKAKGVSFPELTPVSDLLQSLVNGKFDAVAYDDATVADYLKANPGKLKKLFPEQPIAIFPTVMMFPAGETKLKAMFDNTINEILYDGTLRNILIKYNAQDTLRLPAKPYEE